MKVETTQLKNWCGLKIVVPSAVLALLPFLLWSFFVFPLNDDLTPAKWNASWTGFCRNMATWYTENGGLYTSAWLRYIHGVYTHMKGYWMIPLCVLLGHWLVAFWAGMRIFRSRVPWWRIGGYALLWPAFYVCTMPSTSETLYWATGAICYEPGNLLFASLVIMTAGVVLGEKYRLRIGSSVIAHGIVILLCGTHYVHIFNCLAYCFFLCLISSIRARQVQWGLLSLFVTACLCSLVALAAPGNFARQMVIVGGNTVAPLRAFGIAGFSCLLFVAKLITSLPIIIFLGMVCHFAVMDRPRSRFEVLTEWVSAFGWFVALYGVFALSALAKIEPPEMRTQNSLYFDFLFLLVWLLCLLPRRVWTRIRVGDGRRWACAVALVLFLTPNWITATRELGGSAVQYRKQWENRCRIVAEAKAEGRMNVEIPTLAIRPHTACYADFLGADTNYWANTAAARYFGVSSVRAVKQAGKNCE